MPIVTLSEPSEYNRTDDLEIVELLNDISKITDKVIFVSEYPQHSKTKIILDTNKIKFEKSNRYKKIFGPIYRETFVYWTLEIRIKEGPECQHIQLPNPGRDCILSYLYGILFKQ